MSEKKIGLYKHNLGRPFHFVKALKSREVRSQSHVSGKQYTTHGPRNVVHEHLLRREAARLMRCRATQYDLYYTVIRKLTSYLLRAESKCRSYPTFTFCANPARFVMRSVANFL